MSNKSPFLRHSFHYQFCKYSTKFLSVLFFPFSVLTPLREGDTLVVWKLDRLCRSLPDLIKISEQIRMMGAQLVSITESIDTSTPAGRLYFNILGALGQMERELIQERVKAGLAAARRRGKVPGKPRVSEEKLELARRELSAGRTYPEVARILGVHPQTLYRLVPVKSLGI